MAKPYGNGINSNNFGIKINPTNINAIHVSEIAILSITETLIAIISYVSCFWWKSLSLIQIVYNISKNLINIKSIGLNAIDNVLNVISKVTTIHGVQYLSSKTTKLASHRLFWLMLIVLTLLFNLFYMSNEINDYRNYKTQQTIRKKTNIPDKRNLEFCITERLGDLSFFRHLSYYVPKNEIMLFLYRNISFELISYLDNSNQSFDHFCTNFEQTPCLLENYLLYLYNNYTKHLETRYSTYFNQLMKLRASNYYKYIFDMLNWTVYKNDNFDEIDNENNENFLLSLYYPGILKTDPPRFQ